MPLTRRVDRVSPDDLMSLVGGAAGPPLQVGAALLIDDGRALTVTELRQVLADRVPGVPRLRQRLVRPPAGLGRPVWVDDPGFRVERHVDARTLPTELDEAAVLDVAASLLSEPLPPGRPLWRATLVTGGTAGPAAVVLVVHHVLADGLAGLAVLAQLADGAPAVADPEFPRPAPTWPDLAVDAAGDRLRALARVPRALRRLLAAAVALREAAVTTATPCSLNQPTGTRRAFVTARTELGVVRAVAHELGATVNDVVLAVVAGALHRLLQGRGERVEAFVMSVPFSARRRTTASDLGNRSGVVTVPVPGEGSLADRVAATAGRTRAAKRHPRGASTALLGPAFRLLAALGLFGWFIRHQHRIHTFVSNLRGPSARLRLLGRTVEEVVPLSLTTGNVSVAFTVLSYAGVLVFSVDADPDAVPDLDRLRDELQSELDGLRGPGPEHRRRP